MNGVRRFLGGVTATQPPPEPSVQTVQIQASAKPSWPPSPHESTKSPVSALSIRKDKNPQRFALQEEGDSSFSVRSGSHTSPLASPSRSQSSATTASSKSQGRITGTLHDSPKGDTSRLRYSGLNNNRDELLLSLLASEAVIDSREFEILSAEAVEELKREHEALASRISTLSRKLKLETKIRDAAISLSKVNASHPNVSKQTDEQLEASNQKVDTIQREYWRISERANEVQRKLLEHRAGVLGMSVRNMEAKMSASSSTINGDDSGYNTPNPTAPLSPTTSSVMSSSSFKPRFEGPHFFSGHAEAIVPAARRIHSPADVTALEAKLKAATDALTAANQKTAELLRELSLIKLEKEQIQTTLGMELQGAEDTIAALQKEMPRMEALDEELQDLRDEQKIWERDRAALAERESEVEALERRLNMLEEQSSQANDLETMLAEEQERSRREIKQKDVELQEIKTLWEAERRRVRASFEEKQARQLRLNAEFEEGLRALQDLMHTHGISQMSRETTLPVLASSISAHLSGLIAKVEGHSMLKQEWDITRKRLEEDIRSGFDKREALFRECEEARREREEARRDLKEMELRLKDIHIPPSPVPLSPLIHDLDGDATKFVSILQPLWVALPSPETRAAKFAARSNLRANSPTGPGSPKPVTSLAELDVRSLKALYDNNKFAHPPSPNLAPFSIEGFAARVQALIADDKALIERLIRFAQAHDLLKQNAERAQKLAQESNMALETYQKQVRTLEERNATLSAKQISLHDEVHQSQEAVERMQKEKREVESLALDQAETCRQLTHANQTLSAKALRLAEEAAAAPLMMRKQLEECQANLQLAQEEIQAMRMKENEQRVALLDELNSAQTENGNLRAQLRAARRS